MGSVFSKKPTPKDKLTEQDLAILGLKTQRDKMKIAYKRYDTNINKEKEMARQLLMDGKKDRALVLLKRKRYQQTLMDQIASQVEQVERMVIQIESAQLNKDVLERLKRGNEALQVLNEAFSVENVEKIMEDTHEAIELQEEISNILSTKLTADDLDVVAEEYEQMIQDQLRETLPKVPDTQMPEIPDDEKIQQKEKRSRVALQAAS